MTIQDIEKRKVEKIKIFAIMKGVSPYLFKRIAPLNIPINLSSWRISLFNSHSNTEYIEIYTKKIGGSMFWIIEAKETGNQYRMVKHSKPLGVPQRKFKNK